MSGSNDKCYCLECGAQLAYPKKDPFCSNECFDLWKYGAFDGRVMENATAVYLHAEQPAKREGAA